VTVSAHAFSKSAAAKIQKAGGKLVFLTAGASASSERNESA
jgi:ribosomal protein L18E